jgi:hypothetical protein
VAHRKEIVLTPDQLAKAQTEHSHQRALFAWSNMAARYGFDAAWDEQSYTVQGHAQMLRVSNEPGDAMYVVPELLWLFAIPNGGFRDKITAGKLRAEGVKRGVPDVFLPVPAIVRNPVQPMHRLEPMTVPYCGLFVEMKRPKTANQRQGSTSDDQDEWIGYLRGAGYAVAVAFDWREAAKQIQSYIQSRG